MFGRLNVHSANWFHISVYSAINTVQLKKYDRQKLWPDDGARISSIVLVVSVADQSGIGEMIAVNQIPCFYRTCNMNQSWVTLSQRLNDVREKWQPCGYVVTGFILWGAWMSVQFSWQSVLQLLRYSTLDQSDGLISISTTKKQMLL